MVMVIMLYYRNFFLEIRLMVVIDQADDTHNLFVDLPLIFNECFTNKIPDGL